MTRRLDFFKKWVLFSSLSVKGLPVSVSVEDWIDLHGGKQHLIFMLPLLLPPLKFLPLDLLELALLLIHGIGILGEWAAQLL